jgi:glycerol kinase
LDEIAQSWQLERAFEPKMSPDQREFHLQQWQSALKRAKSEL